MLADGILRRYGHWIWEIVRAIVPASAKPNDRATSKYFVLNIKLVKSWQSKIQGSL
jgi:hypothetical protein